ncbi:MAG TPA: hypothetical protein VF641_09395 [Methylobacterium sp.]|jgi:hypothetical protein
MAEAARQMHRELGSDIVRRLVARPIRVDSRGGSANLADLIVTAAPADIVPETETAPDVPDAPDDLVRLRTEMVVLKAVLDAERRESAKLRTCMDAAMLPAPVSEEARAVRDRWSALVDRLLHAPR